MRNEGHEMYLGKAEKVASKSFDDKKRYINKIDSIPWPARNMFSTL